MNKAIMSVHHRYGNTKNIGDYIQAIAANQFMNTSKFIDRDALKSYDGERCKLIMNGWFTRGIDEFPPSDNIVPLITSFHITPSAVEGMLTHNGIAYLRRYEPIGCRDHATKRMLASKGVDAYFSSCLTLTLGRSYKSKPCRENVLFVDPIIPNADKPLGKLLRMPGMWLDLLISLVPSVVIGRKLKKNCDFIDDGLKGWVKAFVYGSLLFRGYRLCFGLKTLMKADYASHRVKWGKVDMNRVDEWFMHKADEVLRRYEQYPLVVTSRIHCALPCLAMGTHVLFVRDREERENGRMSLCTDAGRLEGLTSYFGTMGFDKDWNLSAEFECKLPVSVTTALPQNDSWRESAARLADQCAKFALGDEG